MRTIVRFHNTTPPIQTARPKLGLEVESVGLAAESMSSPSCSSLRVFYCWNILRMGVVGVLLCLVGVATQGLSPLAARHDLPNHNVYSWSPFLTAYGVVLVLSSFCVGTSQRKQGTQSFSLDPSG